MSVLVGVGLQVNKFEWVSSDDHQMSRRGWVCVGVPLPCDLSHDAFDVTCHPLPKQKDRCLRKHYLPATTVAAGNENLFGPKKSKIQQKQYTIALIPKSRKETDKSIVNSGYRNESCNFTQYFACSTETTSY